MTNAIAIRNLKNKATDLKIKSMLPSYLVYLILGVNKHCPYDYLRRLRELVEEYCRVSGYYKKYPKKEAEANNTIKYSFWGN